MKIENFADATSSKILIIFFVNQLLYIATSIIVPSKALLIIEIPILLVQLFLSKVSLQLRI